MNARTMAIALAVLAATGIAKAQDFNAARIETQRLGDGFYLLFAVGGDVVAGNLAVTIGEDGVLLVDAQFAELAPKYKAAIAELGGAHVDLLVNTHWHYDHTDGNKVLGPDGATIIAQDVSRRMLLHDNVINIVTRTVEQAALGPDALPVITYGHAMSLHFNGEQIDLLHFGPAHTAGDTAVVFRGRDAVHLGDVFNTSGYPFIDADNGGSLRGIIEFCSAVLEQIDRTAIVIPGHGPVSDYEGLRDYVAMLSEIHDRMSALISSGASLEQVMAARITAEWDEKLGDPESFVNRAYTSMTR
jgi:cyclase